MNIYRDTTVGDLLSECEYLRSKGDLEGLMRLDMKLHDLLRGHVKMDLFEPPSPIGLRITSGSFPPIDEDFCARIEEDE